MPLSSAQRHALQRIKASGSPRASSDVRKILRLTEEWTAEQRAAFTDKSELLAILTGRRAGKTSAGNVAMLLEAAQTRDGKFLYVNETKDEAKQLAWDGQRRDGMAAICERLGLNVEMTEDPMEIWFPEINSRIRLTGADDERGVKKLLGGAWHKIWWDEAQKIPPTLTKVIRFVVMPMLLDYNGRILFTGTPVEDMTTWFFEITREEEPLRTRGWSVHRWNLLANPWFGRSRKIGDQWFVFCRTGAEDGDQVGPFDSEEAALAEVPKVREREGIGKLCEKLSTSEGPLTREDPEIQRDGLGRWTASGVMFTYKVNKVPDEVLFYAPDRRKDQVVVQVARLADQGQGLPPVLEWQGHVFDKFPDIEKALLDLPEYDKRDYWFGIGMDIGYSPDPFTITLVAWCYEDAAIYEVGSWGSTELDADQQRGVMMYFAQFVNICVWVGDAGGSARAQVAGWSETWKLLYGIPVIEAKKAEKNIAIEAANVGILRGFAKFRKGSPIVAEMRRIQWVKKKTGKGQLVEAHGIPNDFADSWLYINRMTVPFRRAEPQAALPAPGSPEALAADEDRMLELEEYGGQRILDLGDPDDPEYEPGKFEREFGITS